MSDAEDELFDRDKWGEQLYAGSIEKRGVSAIKNWKTRHVELYETRIVYFTKEVRGTERMCYWNFNLKS